MDDRQLINSLSTVVRAVFRHQKSFMTCVLEQNPDNLEIGCFYMASDRCFYKLFYDDGSYTVYKESTVSTQKVLGWFDDVGY